MALVRRGQLTSLASYIVAAGPFIRRFYPAIININISSRAHILAVMKVLVVMKMVQLEQHLLLWLLEIVTTLTLKLILYS